MFSFYSRILINSSVKLSPLTEHSKFGTVSLEVIAERGEQVALPRS